jgi:hypothetical protein
MKVQCSCGAKFAFEITPEMTTNPVRFVCPACGLDASEFVDGLIRRELGQSSTPAGAVVPIDVTTQATSQGTSQALPQAVGGLMRPALRVRIDTPAVSGTGNQPTLAAAQAQELPRCPKHPAQAAAEKCRVCGKPICPKCMELFGYVCSPLCKAKADSHGIQVPLYAGQKSLVEARLWRRVRWLVWSVGVVTAALFGIWFWYTWFGSRPTVVFSVRFGQPAFSGQSVLAGKEQILFLHGGTLARYDMRQKKGVWSVSLIDKEQIQAAVARETARVRALVDKANAAGSEQAPKMPDPEKLAQDLERQAAAALELRVRSQSIWVLSGEKIVRYDWDTGKATQTIEVPPGYGNLIAQGDELLLLKADAGRPAITRVNLATGESTTAPVSGHELAVQAEPTKGAGLTGLPNRPQMGPAGLPTGAPGKDTGRVMDPAKVAAQAQHMTLPERIALPALLANSWSQERALAEVNDEPANKSRGAAAPSHFESVALVPTRDGLLEFSSRLLEQKTVTRAVMKAPAKSALDGAVNVTQTAEVANEILNEMQRARGGESIQEDVSRYGVTLRRSGVSDAWQGEVIGSPRFFPLDTVTVVAGSKTIIVLDQADKKLWQSTLNYDLARGPSFLDEESNPYGQGPCVERKDALFVFDAGVLTAFELKTGNARWRLPSVGITGLFFDDQGMMYVNSTTASPESIKFSHQININQKAVSVVLKINPASGKILWTAQPGGLVNYVAGKFIYTVQSFAPEEEEDNPYRQETGFEAQPYLRIQRLNPRNGHPMWEHFQQRAPLDVRFDKNIIRLVFKKEGQVLKTL